MAKHKRIVLYSGILSAILLILELTLPFLAPEFVFGPDNTNEPVNMIWVWLTYFISLFLIFAITAFFEMDNSRLVDYWKLAGILLIISLAFALIPMSLHVVTFSKERIGRRWWSTIILFIMIFSIMVWGIFQIYKISLVFGIKKGDSITEFTSRLSLYFFFRNIKVSSNNNIITLSRSKKKMNVVYVNQDNKISKLKFPTLEDSSTDSIVEQLLHFQNTPVVLVYEQESKPAIIGDVPNNVYVLSFSEFQKSFNGVLNGQQD